MDIIKIKHPNEMHVHFRQGDMLQTVVPYTAKQFSRAVVMPNTIPPIVTTQDAQNYRSEILSALDESSDFKPLMMAYLTADTKPDDIVQGFTDGVFFGAKLYPAHATTNSAFGVENIGQIADVLSVMQEIGMPLSVHGEVTHSHTDIFDRERIFLTEVLSEIISSYPKLRVTMEHITTAEAVEFLKSAGDNVAATVTPQHLWYNRNAMLVGGIRPHFYCLPILKREKHRLALRELVTSGFNRVFLGTDSAPHTHIKKENDCGCAGVFSGANALELYAHVFDEENALHHFEKFATDNALAFHNLPASDKVVTLQRQVNTIADNIAVCNQTDTIIPMESGNEIQWKFIGTEQKTGVKS